MPFACRDNVRSARNGCEQSPASKPRKLALRSFNHEETSIGRRGLGASSPRLLRRTSRQAARGSLGDKDRPLVEHLEQRQIVCRGPDRFSLRSPGRSCTAVPTARPNECTVLPTSLPRFASISADSLMGQEDGFPAPGMSGAVGPINGPSPKGARRGAAPLAARHQTTRKSTAPRVVHRYGAA